MKCTSPKRWLKYTTYVQQWTLLHWGSKYWTLKYQKYLNTEVFLVQCSDIRTFKKWTAIPYIITGLLWSPLINFSRNFVKNSKKKLSRVFPKLYIFFFFLLNSVVCLQLLYPLINKAEFEPTESNHQGFIFMISSRISKLFSLTHFWGKRAATCQNENKNRNKKFIVGGFFVFIYVISCIRLLLVE